MIAPKRPLEPPIQKEKEEKEAATLPLSPTMPLGAAASPAPVIPAGVTAMLDLLHRYAGLDPLPELAGILATRYRHLDLEEEALRLISWLHKQRQHPHLNEFFLIDWLRRAAADAVPTPAAQPIPFTPTPPSDSAPALPLPHEAPSQMEEDQSCVASPAAALWARSAPVLRGRLKQADWEVWLSDGQAVTLNGEELVLALPTERAVVWVQRHWQALAEAAVAEVTGQPLRVRWVVAAEQAA